MQLALQVLERPYDERSDCWSMGCIILEMATTATHDANQIAEVLVQIKHSPQASIPFSTHFRSRGNISNTLHRQVYLSQPTLGAGAMFQTLCTGKYPYLGAGAMYPKGCRGGERCSYICVGVKGVCELMTEVEYTIY